MTWPSTALHPGSSGLLSWRTFAVAKPPLPKLRLELTAQLQSVRTCELVNVDLLCRAPNASIAKYAGWDGSHQAKSYCNDMDVDVASVQAGHAMGTFLCGRGRVQPSEALLALPFPQAQAEYAKVKQVSILCSCRRLVHSR